ncbi:MAG TPA: DNA/RNA non-specific endonuclease [Gemmatimonadaceae bacterium]|nr:DNA/RNA non-specific endonuclease [Gemmatimonadaceae bacterium]
MRHRIRSAAIALSAALALAACAARDVLAPVAVTTGAHREELSAAAVPSVYVSEIHYDNVGTDAGEAIEINGPAGTDVTGWSVVLYNGNGGASYNTQTLSGTIPATCGGRGVIVVSYAVNGIQNGGTAAAPEADGIALVNAGGTVVEFLSYEATMTATNGPASGMTSTNIGVLEAGSDQAGQSLQRSPSDVWTGPLTSTFGACNDAGTPPAVVASVTVAPATATITAGATQAFTATAFDASNQPIAGVSFTWSSSATSVATVSAAGLATGIATGDATITATAPNAVAGSAALHVNPASTPGLPDVRFSELHYDNFGTDAGEAIEVEGPAGTSLAGWSVVLYNGNGGMQYNTQSLTGTITESCSGRGVVVVSYPQDGIQNGSPDGLALVNASGTVVEFLSYEGTFAATDGPAAGKTSVDIGASENSSPIGQSLQRTAAGAWLAPAASSFGACNGPGTGNPGGNIITFTGRTPTDPALPVGFQDQIFATVRDPTGATVATTVTWTSETPAIATIDQSGVFTALAAGSATLRATTADGLTTATFVLPTRLAVASTTAQYAGNAEFGEPTDADPSDDFIVRHPEYTASFSPIRNTPNWVSYDLEATHFGPEDRCDCFTYDPALPASFTHYTTNDYTGAGAIAGYGIDRGHLARSFDRTSASLDNAYTFYFSNIVPQAADLNQGPWAIMENYLGDLARLQNKEVYIIAGVAGNKGTVKNEGKIVIPAFTWKVAVIMPRNQGLANIDDVGDLEVIAVIMPNEPGVRNVNWETYKTTVDAVEALSGYDLLALLRDDIEKAVESGTRPPVAAIDGPFTGSEGASIAMSGAGSTDPAGGALTYLWSFGDGSTATGPSVSHTYAQDGGYTVRLIVSNANTLTDTIITTATVSNVAPAIAAVAGATLLPGETYSASGSFTDPGADTWTATVDYGDGGGTSALALAGKTFSLSHVYARPGTFTVTVRVTDDDVTSSQTTTVKVLTLAEVATNAIAIVERLVADGIVSAGNGKSLTSKLESIRRAFEQGNANAASGKLGALLHELEAMIRSGRLSEADAAPLRALIERLLSSRA